VADPRRRLLVAALGFSLLAALPALSGKAFAASLTGNVFVTMRSGDVKRAADVDVLIVPATPEFEGEWERLQTEYEERAKPLVAEYDSLTAQADSLRRQQTAMSGNPRAVLQISNQIIALLNQQIDLGTTRWGPLQQEYTMMATRLLAQRATARIPTDVNGHSEVSVPAGRYYVFCHYQLSRGCA
jgi:hypothetical protein